MKVLLTGDTNLIDFNGEELSVADLALPEVEALTKLVAVIVGGEAVFRHAKARPADVHDQDIVELRTLSQGTIRLPRGTVVILDGGEEIRSENLWGGPCATKKPPGETQLKINNEWQVVRTPGTNPPGAALLKSWTLGVVEVVQNKAVVDPLVPAPLFYVEIENAEALAVTAAGAGEEIPGILVAGSRP